MTQHEELTRPDLALQILPSSEKVKQFLDHVATFQAVCKATLVKDVDYGIIPGVTQPSLLKPGAEKIFSILRLIPKPTIMEQVADWEKPVFAYTIQITLISRDTGEIVGYGVGECNSMESKYRFRLQERLCPQCNQATVIKGKGEFGGGWLCWKKKGGCGAKWTAGDSVIETQSTGRRENEDIWDLRNTILKMAVKRAKVDAALSTGSLSNTFTQDMEGREEAMAQIPDDAEEIPRETISLPSDDGKYQFIVNALVDTGINRDDITKWFVSTYKGQSWVQLTPAQRTGALTILQERLARGAAQREVQA